MEICDEEKEVNGGGGARHRLAKSENVPPTLVLHQKLPLYV